MAVTVRIVRAVATAGNQDFTVTGFGTPKAAIVIVNGATADATRMLDARMSVGIIAEEGAGWNQYALGLHSVDGGANSATYNILSNARVVTLRNNEAGVTLGTGSFIVDGIRIAWSGAVTGGVIVTCILFTGDAEFQAHAGFFYGPLVVGVPSHQTGPGFPVDQVIVLDGNRTVFADTANTGAYGAIGFADNAATVVNQSFNFYAQHNQTRSTGNTYVSTVDIARVAWTSSAFDQRITSFSSTGFYHQATTTAPGASRVYPYLAFGYGNETPHSVALVASPIMASPPYMGNVPYETPFDLQFVLQLPSAVPATNSLRTTSWNLTAGGAGTFEVAAITATEIFTTSISDDDAADPMITESYTDVKFHPRRDATTALVGDLWIADFVSLNTPEPGYTLDYTANESSTTARFWPTLFIGENTGGATVTGTGAINIVATFVSLGSSTMCAQATIDLVCSCSSAGNVSADRFGTSAIPIAATCASTASITLAGNSAISSLISFAATGTMLVNATGSMAIDTTMSAYGVVVRAASASIDSTVTLSATAYPDIVRGVAESNMVLMFYVVGRTVIPGTSAIDVSLTLTGIGNVTATGTANIGIEAGLSSLGTATSVAGATIDLTVSMSAMGAVVIPGLATIAISCSLSASEAGEWTFYGTSRKYVEAENTGLFYGLEVYMRATAEQVKVRLYNLTDGRDVPGSTLATSLPRTGLFELLRSGSLVLEDGKTYRVQCASVGTGAGEILSAAPVIL